MMELLIARGHSIYIRNLSGETPLDTNEREMNNGWRRGHGNQVRELLQRASRRQQACEAAEIALRREKENYLNRKNLALLQGKYNIPTDMTTHVLWSLLKSTIKSCSCPSGQASSSNLVSRK